MYIRSFQLLLQTKGFLKYCAKPNVIAKPDDRYINKKFWRAAKFKIEISNPGIPFDRRSHFLKESNRLLKLRYIRPRINGSSGTCVEPTLRCCVNRSRVCLGVHFILLGR